MILKIYFYIISYNDIKEAIRIKKKIQNFFRRNDCLLWLFTVIATVFSVTLIASLQRAGDYNYLVSQIGAIVIGFIAAILISFIDYNIFIKFWWIFGIIAFILAMLVFLFGIQVAGTDDTAWIRLPGGFTVQPSEFIKICFIFTFTKHLSYLKEKDNINNFLGILTLFLHALIPIIIIHMQGDDGTVLIFAFIFLVMTFAAGVSVKYFAALGIFLVVSIPVMWTFILNNEHRNRILALFDLDGNALTNYGWQQYQGKVSIASGELTGSGLFNGQRVEYGIVPEQQNDFIFTVAGEELGFIGCILILAILFIIILKIALNATKITDYKGKYICYGVFALVSSQTIINIGMVLGFMPVVGITLPFFSAGGSSVLSMLICIGIIQSIVRYNQYEPEKIKVKIGSKDRIKI